MSAPDQASPSHVPGHSQETRRDTLHPTQITSALRYRVQFTADQRFVDLLAEARDLLWHRLPDGDLASVQQLALEALVVQLRRSKYAATRRANQLHGASSGVT